MPEVEYSRKAAVLMNSPLVARLPAEQQWALRDALAEHSTVDSLPPHIKRLFDDSNHKVVANPPPRLLESGFDPARHPRGRRGRFIQFMNSMPRNSMERFATYNLIRTHAGRYVVEPDDGQRTLHDTAEDALDQIEKHESEQASGPPSVLNPATFKSIFDGFEHNGMRAEVVHSSSGVVHGEIKADGNVVGKFTREADGEQSVYHDSLYIEPDYQGRGFGTAFFEHSVDEYRKLGVTRVRVTAGSSVGGYQWARRGFDFDMPRYSVLSRRVVGRDRPLDAGADDERFVRAFAAFDTFEQRMKARGSNFRTYRSAVPPELWDEFTGRFATVADLQAHLDGDESALDGKFQSPQEIAQFGREHKWVESRERWSMGREMWLGKRFLVGGAWRGEMRLV